MTFGNLCDLSMPSCSSSISEITVLVLPLTNLDNNKLFDNLDLPSVRGIFFLLRSKSMVQRERVKEVPDSGAKE